MQSSRSVPISPHLASGEVDHEIPDTNWSFHNWTRDAPQECLHAQDKLAWEERLCYVVVCADLEPDDAVDLLRAGGEDHDRNLRMATNLTRKVDPTDTGSPRSRITRSGSSASNAESTLSPSNVGIGHAPLRAGNQRQRPLSPARRRQPVSPFSCRPVHHPGAPKKNRCSYHFVLQLNPRVFNSSAIPLPRWASVKTAFP